MLVNALSETTIYQSANYSHSTKGRHVVATGHLTAASAGTIVEELFHPDSGFADYNLVFLNPNPPTDAMKRLLKTSQHAHRLLYLQGSYNSQQVRLSSMMQAVYPAAAAKVPSAGCANAICALFFVRPQQYVHALIHFDFLCC